jgi:hypothetical protein
MSAKPLHLRLFLEGIEVPVIAANVTANTNAPASASIQILPLDSGLDLMPRTMVHLFYLDSTSSLVADGSREFSTTDGVYRLLFAGEAHGVSFQQTPMSRGLVLQCLDFSSYWDAAHATAIEFGPNGNAFTHRAGLYGGDTGLFDDIVNNQMKVITGWIRERPKTEGLKSIGGLAGGVIRMMEAMGGVPNHSRGVNDFFSFSELRCHLLQQLVAEENDDTAARLMAGVELMKWLENSIANIGQQVTFRDMMLMLMQYIYYESVPNPTARWTPAVTTGKAPVAQRLRTQIVRPDCWFAVPPACNLIFPEHFTSLSFDRNWTQEVTRVMVQAYNALIGPDELLDSRVVAPSIGSMTRKVAEKNYYHPDASYRTLMDHELHTGIIPRQERLPDTHNVSKDKGPASVDPGRGAVTWAERVAMFHFFKYRFAPRQMNVSGRFNPNIVCGFPSAVIRGPYIPDADAVKGMTGEQLLDYLHKNAAALRAPYHLVGMVAGVTHQINQDGGTTSVAMHSVRRHAGTDDEYMQIVQGMESKEKQVVRVVVTAEHAETNDQVFQILKGLTPQGSSEPPRRVRTRVLEEDTVITKDRSWADVNNPANVELNQSYANVDKAVLPIGYAKEKVLKLKWIEGQTIKAPPYTTRGDIPGADRKGVLVPLGKTTIGPGSTNGFFTNSKVVGVEVDVSNGETNVIKTVDKDGTKVNLYKKVIVYQQIEVSVPAGKPIEETLRPNWMSPSYAPSAIGQKIYQPFFGCDSVIDRATFNTDTLSVTLREGKTSLPTVTAVTAGGKALGDFYVDELRAAVRNDRDMSMEKALNIISFVYGQAKQAGKDVDDFIRQMTYRPIATKAEILGEDGLELSVVGGKVVSLPTIPDGPDGTKKRAGKLGFHTLSVNEKVINCGVPMVGLLDDPDLELPRSSGHGNKSKIPGRFDVRKEKWDRVNTYASFLVGASGKQALRG